MKTADATIPAYVDTETPPRVWYGFHLGVLAASIGMLVIAVLVIEYELAKLQNPGVAFIATPVTFDLIVSFTVAALALANMAILIFVFLRHLWLRRWMLGTTLTGWILLAVMILVLQYRFLPIILPWYR